MERLNRYASWVLLSIVFLSVSGLAQSAASVAHKLSAPVHGDSPAPAPAPPPPKDPRGRGTPQGAVLNFVKYAQLGDYETAAKYLQLPASNQNQQNEEYARQLLVLINSSFRGSIATLNSTPEGDLADVDNPNVEVVGRFVVGDQDVQFLLVRVPHAGTEPIWLISQETLRQVPGLYQDVGSPRLAPYFPDSLMKHTLAGVPLAQWLAWLLTIPLAWGIAWAAVWLCGWLWSYHKSYRPSRFGPFARKPIILLIASLLNGVFVFYIGLPLFYRVYYFRLLAVAQTITFAWLSALVADRIYAHAVFGSLQRDSRSLLQLLHRLYHAAIIIAAILIIVSLLGFHTQTMLAGLGIGGIALALAAQKSLEGILGGITLVMDKTASVGDECVISGRNVTVKEIGLRSLRVTTREGTEMSFPNGLLAQSIIENVSRRSKFLISAPLHLSYECSLPQLQCVIAGIREILYSHAKVEQKSASIRLSGVSATGYQIDLSAYVNAANSADFAAIQEDILFRCVEVVESSGAVWAIPSQVTYIAKEKGIEENKVAASEETVRKWQDTNQVPFPDFSPDHIAEVQGTLAYPPEKSVLRQK